MTKTLMEDKQLDFNRPLISVRRFSSAVAPKDAVWGRKVDSLQTIIPSPIAYRSELKSGPIRNPGTVPFQWEQSPGRPKDERKSQNHPLKRPPLVPKLPPGRTVNAKKHDSDKICKVETVVQSKTNISLPNCQNILSSSINADEDEMSSHVLEEKDNSISDCDEAYRDALDTLSRTDSSLGRSLSSLSRLDGPDMEVSGTFITDPQTLDIMMGRFLPAAKAMISESPQHPSRKQPVGVVQEPPREVIKVLNKIKPHLVKLQQPNLLCHYMQNDAGLRMQSGAPISSVHRSGIESTCTESLGGTDSQVLTKDVENEQKLKGGQQNHDIHADKRVHKRDHQKLYGSSLYRRLQGTTGVSSYHNNHSGNPKYADNSREKELDPQSKGPCIFRDFLNTDQDECRSPSISSVEEKTLYIDPVHKVDSKSTMLSGSKESSRCKDDDCSTIDKDREAVDLSFQDFKHLIRANVDERLTPETPLPYDSYFPSSAKVDHDMQIDMKKCPSPKPYVIQGSQVPDDRKIDLEKQLPKIPDKGSINGAQLCLPPLPKSPSESWLQRTLPILSLKNSSKSCFVTGNDMKNQSSKFPFDPKWENLVKTSNSYHGHLRFSEELLTPIPEA